MMSDDNKMIHRLESEGKEVILLGTAHVSKESVDLVSTVINEEKPDTVCVELCEPRFQAIRQKDRWKNMDIIKVIREKKAFLLLSNLLLVSFQKRIADKFDVKPGEEMICAIECAEKTGADIHLADREIRITMSRTWRIMGFLEKMKILFQLILSSADVDEITEDDIKKMQQEDVLETLLSEIGKSHPALREILIYERDKYLASKIRSAPGEKIVAVVGAGHVPGIKKCWDDDIDLTELETLPPKSKLSYVFKWGLPAAILVLFGIGFLWGGKETGTDMLAWWILANGILAGIGAIIAVAHPLTIISAIVAAPLTSLNPAIAAGWVSGLVEAFLRKPKVKDFETLPDDILSAKGFWKNKVTRILLVVVFTNLGSAVGTFVAIPLLLKLL